ncbi:MAG: glycosyltransferase, partial [Halobacteriaceae archaeon]
MDKKVWDLAADETLMNIVRKLPHYRQRDRLAHWWCHRHVDGVLAISPQLTAEARAIGIDNVRTIHPFPTPKKWEQLGNIEPDHNSNQVLVVGSNVAKNGLDILQDVADEINLDIEIDVAGPQTKELSSKNVTGHGFVPDSEFYNLFRKSAAFLLPARSQAFALSPIEAMRAGIPPVVTVETGCQAYIGKAAPELVNGRRPDLLAESLEWALENPDVADRIDKIADLFNPTQGVKLFRTAY